MPKKSKKSNIRKSAAIGLAFLGLAGVTVASAATLSLDGEDNANMVQAGVTDLSANLCQLSTINVTFTLSGATPGEVVEGTPFGYQSGTDALSLASVDGACSGKNIEVALGDADGDQIGGEYQGIAAGGALTINLNGGAPNFGAPLTNQEIAEIAQVSVTIWD